ncbi:MAG: hypothetical protein IJ992_08855, partial [Lentisphaeria bacterium]|nr:hypothetical protein [Lentisphaeria bacterium]
GGNVHLTTIAASTKFWLFKATQIYHPQKLIFGGDTARNGNHELHNSYTVGSGNNNYGRHNNKSTMLFFDSHAAMFKQYGFLGLSVNTSAATGKANYKVIFPFFSWDNLTGSEFQ